jgi:hypothetical protein
MLRKMGDVEEVRKKEKDKRAAKTDDEDKDFGKKQENKSNKFIVYAYLWGILMVLVIIRGFFFFFFFFLDLSYYYSY